MTAHSPDDHGHAAGQEHGHGSLGTYISVFLALCVLTAISFAVGSSKELRMKAPEVMMAMMILVSCAKAMLVILFFMHLKYEANWKYVLTVPASIMSLFLMFMLWPDIGRRTHYYTEERWLYAAEPVPPKNEHATPPGSDAKHSVETKPAH